MNKILVSYFSASGITKKVAQHLATCLEGDLLSIEPVELYSNADLDWNDPTSRSSKEMNDPDSRPKIIKKDINVNQYDKILIGFPIWWGLAPRVIHSFIEENDWTGKEVYVFATSGGSGIATSFEDLKRLYPNIHFVKAKLLSSFMNDEELTSWILS